MIHLFDYLLSKYVGEIPDSRDRPRICKPLFSDPYDKTPLFQDPVIKQPGYHTVDGRNPAPPGMYKTL